MGESANLERLSAHGTALVSDTLLRLGTGGWMDGVRPLRPEAAAAGKARTVLFGPKGGDRRPGRGYYELIETLEPGDVLVIATGGTNHHVLGDNVVTWAQAHGLAAIVTDGCVRDASAMSALAIPVFNRGVATRPPLAIEPVAFDVTLCCGGATVHPGDIVVGDGDGVVIVPAGALADLLGEIMQAEAFEREMGKAIAARRPGGEIQELAKGKKTRGAHPTTSPR
jgi:regulator of RNase E activity RraA